MSVANFHQEQFRPAYSPAATGAGSTTPWWQLGVDHGQLPSTPSPTAKDFGSSVVGGHPQAYSQNHNAFQNDHFVTNDNNNNNNYSNDNDVSNFNSHLQGADARRDITLDRIYDVANQDVEMVDVGVPVQNYLVLDTNFLLDHFDVLQRFTRDLEKLGGDSRFGHVALGLKIIVPAVVLSELDGVKKKESTRWFAQRASTWLLEKTKERKVVKVQSRKETVYDPTITVGDVTHNKNDLAIFDCVQYFKAQGGVCLVSSDVNLLLYCQTNGVDYIQPPKGRWTSRRFAYQIFGDGIPGPCFNEETGSGYRHDPSEKQRGIVDAPRYAQDDAMDVDDEDITHPDDYEPSHALDALHLQIIDQFTLVLREVAERVRMANNEHHLAHSISQHAPAYRRKAFELWGAVECLEYLETKKKLQARSPPLRLYLLRRNENRGWRRGQDWTRQDWRVAMEALKEIGEVFEEGVVLESLESLRPHVDGIFEQPMRPTG